MSDRARLRRGGRPSAIALLLLTCLVAGTAGCGGHRTMRDDVEVVAEGSGWWLGVAPGPELRWQRREPDRTTASAVSEYADPPVLAEASHLEIPLAGRDVALVAGPVRADAASVLVTTDLGAEHDATLFEAQGWQWFLVELADTEAVLTLEAYDAAGEVVDTAELALIQPPEATTAAP
ncbi:hypothetical protein [Egicoccus sp. AB-alg2]|uniref:hypothetical protein n=1 Tax=Egicoccus sp. AB-alg2 TaxID=3242693 RepID=UPI00359F069D